MKLRSYLQVLTSKYLHMERAPLVQLSKHIHSQQNIVQQWFAENLDFALTQPHAVYAAFAHDFIVRTIIIEDASLLFKPLEDSIYQKFIPALMGVRCLFC